MLEAGQFNRRVTIQTPAPASDGAGGQVATWAGVCASGTLTLVANPAAGKTVTVGATVYTLRTALTAPAVPYEVLRGGSAAETRDHLVSAILATAADAGVTYGAGTVAHTQVTAEDAGSLRVMRVVAKVAGTAGNAIATTSNDAGAVWGAATLSGGVAATHTEVVADLATTGPQAWARVEPLRGNQLLAAQQIHADTRWRVTMRYRTGLSAGMRLAYPEGTGVRVLQVVAVLPDPPRGVVVCDCREVEP
jgi:SPP1 family predicted phage head-tail adaptor